MRVRLIVFFVVALSLPLMGCSSEQSQEVTATAYNSVNSQTKAGDPSLTAWGDVLKPGMKAIAVSRDLIPEGLDHGAEVEIEGLSGTYIVRDKMNKRWDDKIDIYMGTDVEAAKKWGKKTVTIHWAEPSE